MRGAATLHLEPVDGHYNQDPTSYKAQVRATYSLQLSMFQNNRVGSGVGP